MAKLLTYNYFINKYIFNNQICKYNNYIPKEHKSFTFNTRDDVKNFINYYHFKNHDFGDLSLADEIVINDKAYNKTWLIAGFNTQLDSDVNNGTFGKHHLTLIPTDYYWLHARMYYTDDNSKGFANTEVYNILSNIDYYLSRILGSNLLSYLTRLSIDNKNMKQFLVQSMLLNYNQAFGTDLYYQYYYNNHYETSFKGTANNMFDNGDDVFQLPLFNQDVKYRTVDKFWWLRNLYSNRCFVGVSFVGDDSYAHASNTYSDCVVRPFICLG